eukprot:scaffold15100_cov27-Tisochrysis_lutea.AAC.7
MLTPRHARFLAALAGSSTSDFLQHFMGRGATKGRGSCPPSSADGHEPVSLPGVIPIAAPTAGLALLPPNSSRLITRA